MPGSVPNFDLHALLNLILTIYLKVDTVIMLIS